MPLSDNLRGVILMCVAMVAFTVNDAFMKAATVDLPVFQAIVMRGALTTVALGVIAASSGALAMRFSGFPADGRTRPLPEGGWRSA